MKRTHLVLTAFAMLAVPGSVAAQKASAIPPAITTRTRSTLGSARWNSRTARQVLKPFGRCRTALTSREASARS